MIQRFRKCWLQDKNKLGVQLLSDLGSCSRLSYIFWILNISNPPSDLHISCSWTLMGIWGVTVCNNAQVCGTCQRGRLQISQQNINAAHSLHSCQLPTGLGTLLNCTTQHKSCSSEDALTQLFSQHKLAPTPCSCPVSLLQQPGDSGQHFHWLSFTLLMQLLDSNKPLHHLRHRSWHGIPLLHHIIQLWHLKGYTYSLNHQVECVYFS